jgi:hypothetical protein
MEEGRLAGDRLHDRDAVGLSERPQRLHRARIVHAAAGDDHRTARSAEHRRSHLHVTWIRRRTPDVVDGRLEEDGRVVIGLGLDVLR